MIEIFLASSQFIRYVQLVQDPDFAGASTGWCTVFSYRKKEEKVTDLCVH